MSEIRKLSTILFADIQGYTSLMQSDEQQALYFLKIFKEELNKHVPIHGGQIVQYFGDAVLLAFDSAVEGVQCGIALQKAFIQDAIPIRIGMHLGDVVFKENNAFGDGVNVASRIESMGIAGSVLISKAVQSQIKNQVDISLHSLGKFDFKNVEEAVEVFAVSSDGLVVPERKALSGKFKEKKFNRSKLVILLFSLVAILAALAFWYKNQFPDPEQSSNKPRLAVLDFTFSGESQDEYFGNGILDELNSRLIGLQNLEVIARSSIASYKGTKLTAQEVGKELKVDYVLEGKIDWQDKGTEIKLSANLIDVNKNTIAWKGQFQRKFNEASSLQADLALELLKNLNIALTTQEEEAMFESLTTNHLAYQAYLKGMHVKPPGHGTEEDFKTARKMFQQAVALDPEFGMAWLELGNSHMDYYWYGYQSIASMDTALTLIQKASELMPGNPVVQMEMGDYHYRLREYDKALVYFSNALEERPKDSAILQYIAELWRRQGLFEQAIEYMEQGLELDPLNHNIVTELSWTNIFVGNFERSLELQQLAKKIEPESLWNHLIGSFILYSRGREGDLAEARKLLENVPNPRSDYPASFWIQQLRFEGDLDGIERLVNNLNVDAIELQISWEPKELILAMVYLQKGNFSQSKKYFQDARLILEKKVQENPLDFRMHTALGIAYAGLGEEKNAIKSGMKSMELLPIEKDHLLGLDPNYGMMRIYALLGKEDEALDMMSKLLSVPCQYRGFFFTKNPEFAKFRNNIRFQDLLEKQRKLSEKV